MNLHRKEKEKFVNALQNKKWAATWVVFIL